MIGAAVTLLVAASMALIGLGVLIGLYAGPVGSSAFWMGVVLVALAVYAVWMYRIAVDGVALYFMRVKGEREQ